MKTLKPSKKKELRTQEIETNATMVDGIPHHDDYDALNQSYELHSWVYAAAWAIASNYAQMEYKAFRQVDEKWKEYPQHEWVKLLQKPNPYMGGYQMREMLALSLDLTGNSYWIIEKSGGKAKYIWPVPSHLMLAVSSKTKLIEYYLYEVNGEKIRFEYNEVVHIKYSNPRDLIYGQGSLAAAKMAVMVDIYAQAYNRYFFKNASRPDAVLETENSLSEDVRKRVLEAWKLWNQGVENRGKTVIMEGGLKLHEINRTMKDMEFTQLRTYSRQEILGAFGVPPIMVGITDSANLANSTSQVRLFWQHSIMPRARSIQDQLTIRIQQITFDPLTRFESDHANVEAMQKDFNLLADVATKFVNLGIPLNQVIDKLDLPFEPVEGGDETSLGADEEEPGEMDPDQEEEPEGQEPKKPPKEKPKPEPKAHRAVKVSIWKAFDQASRIREEDMKLDVRSFFRGQKRRVIKALEANAGNLLNGVVEKQLKPIEIEIIFDGVEEAKRMRRVTDPHVSDAYLTNAAKSARKFGRAGVSFDLSNPKVLAILEEKELKLVRKVTGTTADKLSKAVVEGIKESLAEGFKQGEAIERIAERITEVFDLSVESRAETIARTEILSATNAGALDGMKAVGVETKEWLPPQDDAHSRDWHQDLGGEAIPIEEKFITELGNAMDAPHDPGAPAEEVINCRCHIIGGGQE